MLDQWRRRVDTYRARERNTTSTGGVPALGRLVQTRVAWQVHTLYLVSGCVMYMMPDNELYDDVGE